jgi:UDP-N-acetylmuramate dehydrogenase
MKNKSDLFTIELKKSLPNTQVLESETLARYCNWRIGGPADVFVTAKSSEELISAVKIARQYDIPITILGFGANVLVSDRGIRGLVILNRTQRIEFKDSRIIEADSGTNLAVLAKACAQQGLSGLEFLIGIPGTVGAAVAVNAGTREEWIHTILESALLLDSSGEAVWTSPADLEFAYRNSRIKRTGEIVISARFAGKTGTQSEIEKKMNELLQVRKSQPTGPSAGSVFKNPGGDFAGRLIESCGLKGKTIGGAQIAELHGNFILNIGGGTSRDVRALIELAKNTVQTEYGVELEEEIQYLGEW